MITRLKRFLLAGSLLLTVFVTSGSALANPILDPSGGTCGGNSTANSSAVCTQAGNKDNPLTGCPSKCGHGILNNAVNIISFIAGAAAIIIMIVSGLRFATSGSDISTNSRTDTDIENARRSLVGAIVGLVVIIAARFLINFVLSKL